MLNDPSAIYAGKKRKAHGQPSSGPDATVCCNYIRIDTIICMHVCISL